MSNIDQRPHARSDSDTVQVDRDKNAIQVDRDEKQFFSYRREDTKHLAGRLADRLIQRLVPGRVFMDIYELKPGDDFATEIKKRTISCEALIALIGSKWLTITDQQGRRRVEDPNDLVTLEIRGSRVVTAVTASPALAYLRKPCSEIGDSGVTAHCSL